MKDPLNSLEDLGDREILSLFSLGGDVSDLREVDQISREEEWRDTRDSEEEVLVVGARQFAYLDESLIEESGYGSIETYNIMGCVGVGLRSDKNLALAHMDGVTFSQFEHLISELYRREGAEFEEARILTNYPEEPFYRCYGLLKEAYGEDNVEVLKGKHGTQPMSLGVDREGFYFPFDSESIRRTSIPGKKTEDITELTDVTEYILDIE